MTTPKPRQIDYIERASVAVIAASLCCVIWIIFFIGPPVLNGYQVVNNRAA